MNSNSTKPIDIDLEVYKFLVSNSNYIDEPFNDILKRLLKLNGQSNISAEVKLLEIYNHKKAIKAFGIAVPKGFKVFKGSTINKDLDISIPETYKNMRQSLLDSGVINHKLEFTKDHVFTSSSTAASIVFGGSRSGNREWKEPL
ncbi:MAG: hypothetical protein JWO06_2698 [Bacteroidota bacterium]|nr:hypothetical protein [Bacteroidota bacterium]